MEYKFTVHWQTTPTPGLPFYQGTQPIWAEDEEAAERQALLMVRKQSFPDFTGISHLKAVKIVQE